MPNFSPTSSEWATDTDSDRRRRYVHLTEGLYWCIKLWVDEGRLTLDAPMRATKVPDVADCLIFKLLGYSDINDLLDNMRPETQDTLAKFKLGKYDGQYWIFFKILEARANE